MQLNAALFSLTTKHFRYILAPNVLNQVC